MSEEKEIKFVRLKSPYCMDLIGLVTQTAAGVRIENPMVVDIETIFEEGRQILMLHEFLPQSIVEMKEVEFLTAEIFFISGVKSSFIEQYESASEYLYTEKEVKSKKKKGKQSSEDNVVSIMEAMITKKDKPVH